jgi:hypothetical protein
LLATLRENQDGLDEEFSASDRYRVDLDQLDAGETYRDPMGQHPRGDRYRRDWIAAQRSVVLKGSVTDDSQAPAAIDTGLVVVVHEDYDLVSDAVHQLGNVLLEQGLMALSSVVLLVVLLWHAVARALADPNETVRRRGGTRPPQTTIHSMETIELPRRLKR